MELPRYNETEEYQDLLIAIDHIVQTYYNTASVLDYEQCKSEFIVEHLEQGIIMLDDNGIVLENNSYTNDTLKLGVIIGKQITDILSDAKCSQVIGKALLMQEEANCEVMHDETLLYFDIKPLSQMKQFGYMISVKDITKKHTFGEMRYQFVSNVTHELKTPLTSIKGFVETLQMGAIEQPEVATRFLEIIELEADRLYALIEDILLLSDIEQTPLPTETEVFNMRRLLYEVIELLSPQAASKVLKLHFRLENITYEGDRNHFKQIFINLLSNSIRYTEEGRINIYLKQAEDDILIIFQDTGVGIAPAHTDRIFERFYRVDKSPSPFRSNNKQISH